MEYIICNKELANKYGLLESTILGYKYINPKDTKETISKNLGIGRKTFYRLEKKSDFLNYKFSDKFPKQPHWKLNIEDINNIGLDATLLLQYLKDLYYIFQSPFFQTEKNMIKNLPLGRKEIINSLKILRDNEYIYVEKRGINKNNYYTINCFKTKLEGNRVNEENLMLRVEELQNNTKKIKVENFINIKLEDLLEFYDNEEMEDSIKIMKIYKSFNSQSLSYN